MTTFDKELGYTESIDYQYNCTDCGEEWTTEIYLADYEEEPYINDNTCPHCHNDIKGAWKDLRGYEKETILKTVKYILKRIYNKTINKLKIK